MSAPDQRRYTARLCLRACAPADEDVLWRQWNEPDVARYLFDGRPVPRELVRAQIEASQASFAADGFGFYVLETRQPPPDVLGFAGLRRYGNTGAVELLYALRPDCWGRGLASEAAAALLEYGLATLGLARIDAGADVPNRRSFEVMRRIGLRPPEGPERTEGVIYWSLSRDEYLAAAAARASRAITMAPEPPAGVKAPPRHPR